MTKYTEHVLPVATQSSDPLFVDLLSKNQQQQLRAILEQGLPKTLHPYSTIAKQIQASQQQVIAQITQWKNEGLVKRFGLVVKHRQLGYKANAMVVWNIKDEQVDYIASLLSSRSEVSLCYRRPRRSPHWHYYLFCIMHGIEREIVLSQIDDTVSKFSLEDIEKDVLFSFKAFKQHGARYLKSENNQGNEHG